MLYWTRLLWASRGGVNIGYSGYSVTTGCGFPNLADVLADDVQIRHGSSLQYLGTYVVQYAAIK